MRGVQSVRHSQREITQLVIKNVEEKSGREKGLVSGGSWRRKTEKILSPVVDARGLRKNC